MTQTLPKEMTTEVSRRPRSVLAPETWRGALIDVSVDIGTEALVVDRLESGKRLSDDVPGNEISVVEPRRSAGGIAGAIDDLVFTASHRVHGSRMMTKAFG